ncbi:uncharacterized protein LOC126903660 isoform X2 [Daktulosphaira vitifoliae]|uniref:uncharacterized protein LOC126903660 isoform X2 n=1 Tax=Daktulosphaira vitifoliae TaxID=58002 RepID=UPI0021AA27D2|nr:uncharacterized protein LOC126903660 isoform X2 [Daktulosphaira vitifoliae]
MNTKVAIRFYQTVKPHKPLIRFRYGVTGNNHILPQDAVAPVGSVFSLEHNELPLRFKRGPLDEAEINAINAYDYDHFIFFCTLVVLASPDKLPTVQCLR